MQHQWAVYPDAIRSRDAIIARCTHCGLVVGTKQCPKCLLIELDCTCQRRPAAPNPCKPSCKD